ncbi:nitroreductase family deazaflavin-dependent oxidoreductase [Herbiconiux sp. CPCC 205763]|uniref:Nitroreductase family deazaflavin-dependent oxidoreductase n=1 Tax=Herbiconiux aconitum TaxID=2970913 RepID=A0ABT2GLP1_9MICO|nr:nitroreductase family deazaflavin-dependent oxidoreductase [Herbiconiux aconitum]MCS5717123.1 nitroreductase family deazaflavin-dependent oxidoreductase [Herbiconiux aconitum]
MPSRDPRLPPRWIIRVIWRGHRALYRVTGGRRGLSAPGRDDRFGMLRLHTVGRRTGEPRLAILGYVDDGDRMVTLAMNGWGDPPPAWLLNLRAHPDAEVDLVDGRRAVRARVAEGEERSRLWAVAGAHRGWGDDLDRMARLRTKETAVVVFEPRQPA